MGFKIVVAVGAALSITVGASSLALAQGKNPDGVNPTHFQCYEVTEEGKRDFEKRRNFRKNPVQLRDQFGESKKSIGKAVFLCTPIINKDDVPYKDHNTHLVCYTVGPSQPRRKVGVKNQFGEEELTLGSVKILCVPSQKAIPRAPALRR